MDEAIRNFIRLPRPQTLDHMGSLGGLRQLSSNHSVENILDVSCLYVFCV